MSNDDKPYAPRLSPGERRLRDANERADKFSARENKKYTEEKREKPPEGDSK